MTARTGATHHERLEAPLHRTPRVVRRRSTHRWQEERARRVEPDRRATPADDARPALS